MLIYSSILRGSTNRDGSFTVELAAKTNKRPELSDGRTVVAMGYRLFSVVTGGGCACDVIHLDAGWSR